MGQSRREFRPRLVTVDRSTRSTDAPEWNGRSDALNFRGHKIFDAHIAHGMFFKLAYGLRFTVSNSIGVQIVTDVLEQLHPCFQFGSRIAFKLVKFSRFLNVVSKRFRKLADLHWLSRGLL